jgi:hypothetical protein
MSDNKAATAAREGAGQTIGDAEYKSPGVGAPGGPIAIVGDPRKIVLSMLAFGKLSSIFRRGAA